MRFIRNHGGAIHPVNDDQFEMHLGLASIPPSREKPAGSPAREATPEEVRAYFARQGLVYDPETNEAHPRTERHATADEPHEQPRATKASK